MSIQTISKSLNRPGWLTFAAVVLFAVGILQVISAIYFFASEEHKKLFKEDPDKYAPQYGGFCAFGVAEGALFPVDINTWQVRDGKLYLNLNPEVLTQFNAHFEHNIAKAEKNWPHLVKKNSR